MLKKSVIFLLVLSAVFTGSTGARCLENDDVSAASAVLYYPEYGVVLFEKNGRERRSMASTTKIMTSLLALEEQTPDREVEITFDMVNVEGTSSGLRAGDRISLEDLVYCMLLESGNDAANSVAVALSGSMESFASRMNERAAEIGMTDTSFVTPSGLDDEEHYTTAYDMALLAAEAVKNERFSEICADESEKISFIGSEKTVTLYNHNKLLESYDGCVGVKTGYTKKSGRCLVSAAERNGVTLIAVTLNAGDDWNDHEKMLDYGFSCVESVKTGISFSEYSVRVVGGEKNFTSVACTDDIINVLKDEKRDITAKVYLEKFLYAPVNAGDTVGFAEYYNGDKLIKTVPLTAKENVAAGEGKY